jgi:hypothetical protein
MTSGTRVARSERSERLFRLWTLPLNEASKVLVTLTSAVPFTHFLIIGRLRSIFERGEPREHIFAIMP